jgi:HSP20 family protein
MDAKDLNVEVSGNTLTVSGSREEEHKEEKEGYRRQERTSGSFSRSVTLPTYVDAGKVNAKYADGVLTVTVPKVPGQGPKRVTVKTA